MAVIHLTGIGWDHPRCMAPLLASLGDYRLLAPDIEITWQTRSLHAFGEGDLQDLLSYDLVVFDHPYCGEIAREHCFLDLSSLLTAAEQREFSRDSLGPSWLSYQASDGIWGLPLDAAAQVASCRPDLLADLDCEPPLTIDQVFQLAERVRARGKYIALPAVPTDAICTFLTLCANAGFPVPREGSGFPETAQAVGVLEAMRHLVTLAHPASLDWNPIRCYDHMTSADDVVYVPYAFGYSNYSRAGRHRPLSFCDIPGLNSPTSHGAILGGAGLGIPSSSAFPAEALDYARFLCGPHYQAGGYCRSGGQPASLGAWLDPGNDQLTTGFFRNTLKTLQNAYLRPTYPGYLPHFRAAGLMIAAYLRGEGSAERVAARLRDGFLGSRAIIPAGDPVS